MFPLEADQPQEYTEYFEDYNLRTAQTSGRKRLFQKPAQGVSRAQTVVEDLLDGTIFVQLLKNHSKRGIP